MRLLAIGSIVDAAPPTNGVPPVTKAEQESTMKVAGSIALMTGANRGLGLAFAMAPVARGPAKV